MARNDTRQYQLARTDRALLRAASTWHAFAITTVVMCVAPVLVIAALLVIEAAIPHRHADSTHRQANAQPTFKLSTACVQIQPVRCVPD